MFIVIEGADGTGKSTQLDLLATALREKGKDVLVVHFPGHDRVGKFFRDVAIGGSELTFTPVVEMHLIIADIWDKVNTVIKPHLKDGGIVLVSRWLHSTIAYQTNRVQTPDPVERGHLLDIITGTMQSELMLKPDMTLMLALSKRDSEQRLVNREHLDAMDIQGGEFKLAVDAEYSRLRVSNDVLTVSAEGSVEEVHEHLLRLVNSEIEKREPLWV